MFVELAHYPRLSKFGGFEQVRISMRRDGVWQSPGEVGTGSEAHLLLDKPQFRAPPPQTRQADAFCPRFARMGFTTDNGNVILDVAGLAIVDPFTLEDRINGIAGVVTVGLFARRGADVVLLGSDRGVETILARRYRRTAAPN